MSCLAPQGRKQRNQRHGSRIAYIIWLWGLFQGCKEEDKHHEEDQPQAVLNILCN